MIPEFRADGYLPEGLHLCTEAECTFRFGTSSSRRRRLTLILRRWLELARAVKAKRFFVDGSFVTSKAKPNDVDAVVWIPHNFGELVAADNIAAVEMENMLLTRQPEELFAAEDGRDWDEWIEFFSRTREADGRRKGLVELEL